MKIAAVVFCLVALGVPFVDATFGLLKAGATAAGLPLALPAAAGIGGGLAAIKVLKLIGLKKLKKKFGGGGIGGGGIGGGGFGSDIFDYGDSYDKYPVPQFAPPPFLGGKPHFFLVPSSHFDGRYKREVPLPPQPVTPPVQEEDYFAVVAMLDEEGCIQRLVCGLSGTVPEALSEDEKIIMSLFKSETAPVFTALRSPKGPYDFAAWVGRSSGSSELTCSRLYGQCDKTPKELMEDFAAIESTENVVEATEAPQSSEEAKDSEEAQ